MLPDNIKAEQRKKRECSLTGKASRILTTRKIAGDCGHVYSCAQNALIIAITELYPGEVQFISPEFSLSSVGTAGLMMLL